MKIELKPEDFDAEGRSDVYLAGARLLRAVAEITYHNLNPGEGWVPFSDEDDTPAVILEIRGHVEQLQDAVKNARRELARIESTARLAAYRRVKAEEDR